MPESESDLKLAENFADFFLNKIEKIRSELSHVQKYIPTGSAPGELTEFRPLLCDEVIALLKRSKATTCDSDPVPSSLIKENSDILGPVITKLINSSLIEGYFYDHWKVATVQPLLKSASSELILSQYRPVSNLSFLSKVIEKTGIKQLNDYLTRHDLHSAHQSAYKENFGTETALCCLMNDLLWSMEFGRVSVMVALDLSAAFDTVEHETLSAVLKQNFGINDVPLNWIRSYLKDRKMAVKVNKVTSSVRTFNYSVPQGSCLGPLLFNLYASTITNCVHQDQQIGGYADDHFVKGTFDPKDLNAEEHCVNQLEDTLSNIQVWMSANTLKMNAKKTEITIFGSKPMLAKTKVDSLNVDGDHVCVSGSLKYLGVWLDCNLNMKQQIDHKVKVAAMNIRRISSIRHFIDKETAKTLASSLVLSHLDYANSVLCGVPKTSLAKLQRCQNWAAKVVLCKGKYDSSTDALKSLHWLPIKFRIDFKILCLIYKSLHEMAPTYLSGLLSVKTPARTTRSNANNAISLNVPFTKRRSFADRAFSVYGPKLWNGLLPEIRAIDNYVTFKKTIKTILFKDAFNLD